MSFSFLTGYDDFVLDDADNEEFLDSEEKSRYLWLGLQSTWANNLTSHTMIYDATVQRDRNGYDRDESFQFELKDHTDYAYSGIKQDWEYNPTGRHLLKAGWSWRTHTADYDYDGSFHEDYPLLGVFGDGAVHKISRDGDTWSAYLSDRYQLMDSLTAELGIRYDKWTWLDDSGLSPRLVLRYTPMRQLSLQLAGGRFYQPKGVQDLAVADNDLNFGKPAYADRLNFSVSYRFSSGLDLRLEAYDKRMKDLSTRYENFYGTLLATPEFEPDRIALNVSEAHSYGVEVVLQQDYGGRISQLFHYSRAVAKDLVDGVWIPRRWDQRHTAGWNLNYRKQNQWNLSLAYSYHS
ncbi:MAG: TonB-dependent receptor, partial [Pseudomonadales bacterium]|nr:TonB-dependent receptor [Pseudomonadales bacterium]